VVGRIALHPPMRNTWKRVGDSTFLHICLVRSEIPCALTENLIHSTRPKYSPMNETDLNRAGGRMHSMGSIPTMRFTDSVSYKRERKLGCSYCNNFSSRHPDKPEEDKKPLVDTSVLSPQARYRDETSERGYGMPRGPRTVRELEPVDQVRNLRLIEMAST
jgi:hypothetical protein